MPCLTLMTTSTLFHLFPQDTKPMKNLPQIYFLQFFISFKNSFSPYNLVNMVTMVIKFIVLMYKAIMPHHHPSAHVPLPLSCCL